MQPNRHSTFQSTLLILACTSTISATACASRADGSSDTASAGDTGDEGLPVPEEGGGDGDGDGDFDPNVCPGPISIEWDRKFPAPYPECGFAAACDTIAGNVWIEDDVDGIVVLTPETLACAHAVLESGKTGVLYFDMQDGFDSETATLRLYEGGRVGMMYWWHHDKSGYGTATSHMIDPDYRFSDCPVDGRWQPAWRCVRKGLLDCESWGDGELLCP